jgi:cytochrome P450
MNEPQPLQVGEHHLLIPPKVYVNWDFAGAQTDPRRWGPDAMEYRPQRWIHTDPHTGQEVLEAPSTAAEAAFNPWSGGPRVCPGKKFSQVEIVAMTATLLKSYSVKPMVVPGKLVASETDAQRELMRVMNDLELPRRSKTERFREVGVVFSPR